MTSQFSYVTINIMRETSVTLCLLLEMLITLNYMNILHIFCDIACRTTNILYNTFTLLVHCSCCWVSYKNGAKSARRPRLSEIWERERPQLVSSGVGRFKMDNTCLGSHFVGR